MNKVKMVILIFPWDINRDISKVKRDINKLSLGISTKLKGISTRNLVDISWDIVLISLITIDI